MTCDFVSFSEWLQLSVIASCGARLLADEAPQPTVPSPAAAPVSSLTRQQHAEYLKLSQKARAYGPAALSESERVVLHQRQAAVELEQVAFFEHHAAKLQSSRFAVDNRAVALVHAVCSARVQRALASLLPDVVVAPLRPTNVELHFPSVAPERAVPHHLQLERLVAVADDAAVPRFAVPLAGTVLSGARLDHEHVAARFAPVHCDDLAARLAAEHDVDVVVDAAALVALFASAAPVDRLADGASQSPALDALLAAHASGGGEWRALAVKREQRVFVSAPLPPASLSARQVGALFFSEALRPDSGRGAARYDLWHFGRMRVLVRTPLPVALNDDRPVSVHVQLLRSADDPIPCELRSACAERLMTQWLLRGAAPSDHQLPASIVVRVAADTGAVLSSTMTHELTQLQQQQFAALPPDDMAFRWRAVGALLGGAHQLAAGAYLLCHRAPEPGVAVWRCASARATGPAFPIATGATAASAEAEAIASDAHAPSLAELLADVGALNDVVECLPPAWSERSRVPFTFADGASVKPAAAGGGGEAKAKQPVFENVRYCHAFALHSFCKDGSQCKFPHLTQAQASAKAAESTLLFNVRYCHAFAVHGQCRDGSECKYPHLTQAQAEAKAKATKNRKRKQQ
jgi:hypothetical protein